MSLWSTCAPGRRYQCTFHDPNIPLKGLQSSAGSSPVGFGGTVESMSEDGNGDPRQFLARRLIQLLVEVINTIRQGQQSTASSAQREEARRMVQSLAFVIDQLGPENIIWIEDQTRLAELPGEVLDAIELKLDEEHLSPVGKILEIARLLLGGATTTH